MLAQERQTRIHELLREKGAVQVADLTRRFNASVATIRRDLEALENEGRAKRVYGGAVGVAAPARTQPQFSVRRQANASRKERIGRAAADLIRDNETVYLDIGTTTLEVARHLRRGRERNLTILTNSVPIINELVDTDFAVYCLGGRLLGNQLCFAGDIAADNLQSFFVDKAIVGVGGLTLREGMSDYHPGNAQLRRTVLERAGTKIVVTDSSKFGINAFAMVGGIDQVDTIVTDAGIPGEYADGIRALGVELMLVE